MALGRPKKPRSDPDANTDTHGATIGYEAELWQMADAFEERRALLESEREGVLVQIEPFPVGKQGEETALTPPARQRGLDLFTQLFNERFAPSPRVPVERKIFMNLNEAAEYSGMPKSWLLQKIKQDELAAFKFRGWRCPRR